MVRKQIIACCLCLLLCALSGTARADEAETFKTSEYFASGALDIINAADAYALGYTGKGQVVGILDTAVRIEHPELTGKAESYPLGFTPDWAALRHGSHVAGIIAAKRDGTGMHGVAFDADIWCGALLNAPVDLDLEDYFARRPEIRIFNNSWGNSEWLGITQAEDGEDVYDDVDEFIEGFIYSSVDHNAVVSHAVTHPESVFVFAAGNEGGWDPGAGPASFPTGSAWAR